MRKKIVSIVLSSVMVLLISTQFSTIVAANENQNGGQVATDGVILFYEDSTSPTTEPTTEPTSDSTTEPTTEPSKSEPEPKPTDSSEPPVKKPVGRLPSTGEIIKGFIGLSGLAVIIVFALLFFKRRQQDKGADE